jgi:hypothetical protein
VLWRAWLRLAAISREGRPYRLAAIPTQEETACAQPTLQDSEDALLYFAECVVAHGERFAPFLDKVIVGRDRLTTRQDPAAQAKAILGGARNGLQRRRRQRKHNYFRSSGQNKWRTGRDLNPRYPCGYAAFRVRCIQPLCHLSAVAVSVEAGWLLHAAPDRNKCRNRHISGLQPAICLTLPPLATIEPHRRGATRA